MCGRFVLLSDLSVVVKSFCIDKVASDYRPDVNIAPGRQIAALVRDGGSNRLVDFQWGLIPAWTKDPSIGSKMFNARAETLAEKPSFREAFKKRRCLVIADGFYEWQKTGGNKKPLRFGLQSGRPFGLAGLYESWLSPQGKSVRTCTIITTEANDLIRPVHHRMPAIIGKDAEDFWLDPENGRHRELLTALKPYPPGEMVVSEAALSDPCFHAGHY